MTQFIDTLVGIFQSSGFARFGEPGGYLYAIMICVGCFLLYLAIVKEFEPLILLPMAFGMILANLPGSGIIHMQYFVGDGLEHPMWVEILNNGGLADMLYMGVKLGIYPPLIFLGIGTMTDFAPLISNPKSLLLGAAAQFGIFGTYMGARLLAATGIVDFTQKQSAAIAIIGGADGPTAIFVTSRLAPELLGSIAVAAYSYMALVPVIQPPIMKALTTKKERTVVMKQLRTVSKTERIIFPIMVTIIVSLIVPDAAVLVGMLMLGNLMKECGVVDRIQNRHLAVEMLRLGFEQFDRLLDHIAQAGALALGEVADRILHVGRRIAVLGEDRLVEIQRIGPHPPMLHVGIREECVVKDERELLVGDDLVSRTGQQQARYQYIYKSFHIPFVFNSRFPASARPKQELVIAPCGRRPCRPHEPRAAPSRPSSPPSRPRKPPRRPPRRPRAAGRGSS